MKKIFFNILIVLFIFIFNYKVEAQTPTLIPGFPIIDCGNAEASIEAQRMCCKPTIDIPNISPPSVLSKIPDVGKKINQFREILLLLQRGQNIPLCLIGYPSSTDDDPSCYCIKESEITPTPIEAAKNLCEKYINSAEKDACFDCADKGGYWSGLTCLYGNVNDFITQNIFVFSIGLAGIVALFCIIYAAFQIQTSQGSPEKIKKAQELLTSCIMGLMLIIFSIFILKLIGVDILRIPGFGR